MGKEEISYLGQREPNVRIRILKLMWIVSDGDGASKGSAVILLQLLHVQAHHDHCGEGVFLELH